MVLELPGHALRSQDFVIHHRTWSLFSNADLRIFEHVLSTQSGTKHAAFIKKCTLKEKKSGVLEVKILSRRELRRDCCSAYAPVLHSYVQKTDVTSSEVRTAVLTVESDCIPRRYIWLLLVGTWLLDNHAHAETWLWLVGAWLVGNQAHTETSTFRMCSCTADPILTTMIGLEARVDYIDWKGVATHRQA